MTPSNTSGRPSARRSQASTTSSSSVAAGEVRHSIACWLTAVDRKSARAPGVEDALERLGPLGGVGRQRFAYRPGLRLRQHRIAERPLEVFGEPVHETVA